MTQDQATALNTAHLSVQEHCAIITLDNPPVNGLGMELRQAISAHLSWAQNNAEIHSVMLIGQRGVFCAGADIRQMNTPKYWTSPRTIELAAQIDSMTKPVVALLAGIAMGGGLELSLGCHYRLAMEDTKIAQPEIKLGLLPGGGGILRLPRLLGLEHAIEMLLNGETLNGHQALAIGLIDQVVPKTQGAELLSLGLAFVQQVLKRGEPLRRTRDLPLNLQQAPRILEQFRRQLRHSAGMAPQVILDCIQACLHTTFEEGVRLSNEATQKLMQSEESAALRHLFFIQRQASKLPSNTAITPRRSDSSIELHVLGDIEATPLQHDRVEGWSVQVLSRDFNAPIQEDHGALAMRLYPGSELVEVLCPKALITSDALTRVLEWLKKNQKIAILSQSWNQALVAPLVQAMREPMQRLDQNAAHPNGHELTQELHRWGLQELLAYVDASPLLSKDPGPWSTGTVHNAGESHNIVQHVLASLAAASDALIAQHRIGDVAGLDLIAVLEMGFPKVKGGPNYCLAKHQSSPER